MTEVPIIDQTISAVAPVLHRDTINPTIPATQDAFVNSAEAFFDKISEMTVEELNTLIGQLNSFRVAVNAVSGEIETASEEVEAAKEEVLTALATLAEGAIDNINIANNKAFSNQFILNELISTRTAKATLEDADYGLFSDSSDTNKIKKISWSNIKATLKTYFNMSYVALTGNQTIAGVKTFTSSPIVPVPTTNFQSVPLKSTNITVNVGAGQTYTTINQALEYLSGFYPMYKKSGVTATINLKAGFVMEEQVLVSGIDLGWITIVGEDAETIITHTALTTAFNGSNYPSFGVDKSGTSPVVGQLFRFNVEKVGGNKHGLMTLGAGSSADVLSGCGFIGAGTYGISAQDCSTINANGANCSNAGTYGIVALYASTINANGANCSNAGNNGINAERSSTINAVQAIIQNQTTGTARIRVQNGSHIVVTGINTTGGTVAVFSQAVNTLTIQGIIYG